MGNVLPITPQLFLGDRLTNVMSGMGTSIDRRTSGFYNYIPVNPQQVEAAYRTSWLMRKIVDIPPLDMTRAWRTWQAEKNNIEALEKAERKLQVKEKCKRALALARLFGGSVIVKGIRGQDPSQPLGNVGKDDLAYLHVLNRHQIGTGPKETDPESEWYGLPRYFTLQSDNRQLEVHPSRVVPFIGQQNPEGGMVGGDWFWGDPIMQSIDGALLNAGLAQDGFAALIDEAKIDIIKIPNLTASAATAEYEQRLTQRFAAASAGKSTWRALVLDSGDGTNPGEEWEQRQVSWAGMPDIIASYLQIVSGAADIPATRLLGQSPKGLGSNGDSERRDYHDMIAARQEELLAPALDRIDTVLIPSVLGSMPSDIWYKFNSLEQMTPEQAAKIEADFAKAAQTYVQLGVLSDEAMADIIKNRMIESGNWPGAEAAFEEHADPEADGKEVDPDLAGEGGLGLEADPPRRATGDE